MNKAEANKANAQRSSGPRSAAGKSRSSRNAVSHGFQSNDIVLAHEDAAEFEHILQHYQAQVDLNNPEQVFLAGEIANAQWRVRRAQRLTRLYLDLEISGFSAEPSPDETIVRNMEQRGNDVPATLHCHETHFQRLWWRIHRKLETLRELNAMQWDYDVEERLQLEELELRRLQACSRAKYDEQQQQEAAAAKIVKPEGLVEDFSLEECWQVVDAVEQMENQQTNPVTKPDGAQAFVLALKPADRTRIYEAAKAKIAQTKPAVMAA